LKNFAVLDESILGHSKDIYASPIYYQDDDIKVIVRLVLDIFG